MVSSLIGFATPCYYYLIFTERALIAPPEMDRQQLVLDTNVVLDWIVFRDPGVEFIVRAIESGQAQPVTSDACLEEFRRVLEYPALKLGAAARSIAFERYRSSATLFDAGVLSAPVALPRCTDADDQKFLELAWHANAHWLITKDRALLKLARAVGTLGRFAVVKPGQCDWGLAAG
jgi:putative PIN family toxin of toxin-antitoxin system